MKTSKEYLESPSNCPNCNSKDLYTSSPDTDINTAWGSVMCFDCKFEWVNYYNLTSFEVLW